MAFYSPFYGEKRYIQGRTEIQDRINRAIYHQENVRIDKLIITSRTGKGKDFSYVFPAENWEG
jgi:superfamily II DNA/RNA helicase